MRYDVRTQYPEGFVTQIRKRFPALSTPSQGLLPERPQLRQLAERANQAMLDGSLQQVIALRSLFEKEWRNSRIARTPNHCCIGGAFMSFTSFPGALAFPSSDTLGKALQRTNPALNPRDAEAFAREMLSANDSGDFEMAWRILDEALAHGRTRTRVPMTTVHTARVADLDIFVADDTITVLVAGELAARDRLPGLSELIATGHTQLKIRHDAAGCPNEVRVCSGGQPPHEFLVFLGQRERDA